MENEDLLCEQLARRGPADVDDTNPCTGTLIKNLMIMMMTVMMMMVCG